MLCAVDTARVRVDGTKIVDLSTPNTVIYGMDFDARTNIQILAESERDSDQAGLRGLCSQQESGTFFQMPA